MTSKSDPRSPESVLSICASGSFRATFLEVFSRHNNPRTTAATGRASGLSSACCAGSRHVRAAHGVSERAGDGAARTRRDDRPTPLPRAEPPPGGGRESLRRHGSLVLYCTRKSARASARRSLYISKTMGQLLAAISPPFVGLPVRPSRQTSGIPPPARSSRRASVGWAQA